MNSSYFLILIGLFIVQILTTILISFVKEKSKNAATKQDIEDITKKIESIKNEISHTKQKESEFIQERKLHIISLLEVASSYKFLAIRTLYSFNNITNPSSMLNLLEEIHQKAEILQKKYMMVEIYGDNKNISEHALRLTNSAIDLHNCLVNTLNSLENLATNRLLYLEEVNQSHFKVSRLEEFNNDITTLCSKFEEDFKIYEESLTKEIVSYRALIAALFKLNFHKNIEYST